MENLNNIKKITKGILLNEIFNLFNLWIEKKMIFKRDDLINLFKENKLYSSVKYEGQ